MEAQYDLRDRPWLPVRIDGRSVWLGLRELFLRAHEIEDLEVPVPPAASGLLRILYVMASRIARADDGTPLAHQDVDSVDDWLDLRTQVLGQGAFDPAAVAEYFDGPAYSNRFDLFDPDRPFLQDPRLGRDCPSSSGVNKLVLGRPTGVNGAVWFGHHTDVAPVAVDSAEAVWHMVAQLYYGPSGQCTPRRITQNKPGNGDAGPLRKTVSFHPWGPNLFTTLVLGVPFPSDEEEPAEADAPWEEDSLPDPLGPLPAVTWPGRLLAGRARHAALLVPSAEGEKVRDAYITWSTHESAVRAADPYVVWNVGKEGGLYARTADGNRAVWRDLDALLLKSSERRSFRRPRIFETVSDLPPALRDAVRVRAYGFDQDGQQRDSGWYTATTPPVLQWMEEQDPAMAVRVSVCHKAAEEAGRHLDYAARLAWAETNFPPPEGGRVKLDPKKPGPWAASATARYWPRAERVFWQLTAREPDAVPVQRPFVDEAEAALRVVVGSAARDLRVARAMSHAVAVLRTLVPSPTQLPGTAQE